MFKTKNNDSVATPAWLYEALDREFDFDHDPCPLDPDPKEDGLTTEWGRCNYVNPPYSKIQPWIARAIDEMEHGNRTVFLVPVKTSTKYWHDLVLPRASEIRLLDQRVTFAGYSAAYPNPMCVIVFDPDVPPPDRKKKPLAAGMNYVSV